MSRRIVRCILGGMLLLLAARAAEAQGTCSYGFFNGNCQTTDSPTFAINLTITRAVLMALSTTGIALDAPSSNDFDAGYGQTAGPTLTVRSNSAWSVSVRVTQAAWTASPAPARANKPAGDLRWALNPAGPFTAMTTSNATIQSGAATAGFPISLQFRVQYAWLLDTPGTYSLPVQLTITAP